MGGQGTSILLTGIFRDKIKLLPVKLAAESPSVCCSVLYTDKTDIITFFNAMVEKNIYFTPTGGKDGRIFSVGHLGDLNKKDWNVTIHRYVSNLPQKINDVVDNDKVKELEENISQLEELNKANKDTIKRHKAIIAANKKQLTKLNRLKNVQQRLRLN